MSFNLPVLSGREVVRVLQTFGWEVVRQNGSHIINDIFSLSCPRKLLLEIRNPVFEETGFLSILTLTSEG
jgi:Holliday junction resolvase